LNLRLISIEEDQEKEKESVIFSVDVDLSSLERIAANKVCFLMTVF
jgi:hypothetical protein